MVPELGLQNRIFLSSHYRTASFIGNVQREKLLSTSFKPTFVRSHGLATDCERGISCSFIYKARMGQRR